MRTKRAVLTALFSAMNLFAQSLLSLVYTRRVLLTLGSDYNGINSTIAQFMSVLMLIESGFSVAALVKLYKPYAENNINAVNKILSKTRTDFRKIGLYILLVGIFSSSIYVFFIKTDIKYTTVIILFFISVFSTFLNIYFFYKYRILFQLAQKEYYVFILNTITCIISYLGMIWIIDRTREIVYASGYQLLCTILSGIALYFFSLKQFPLIKFNQRSSNITIEGTKDLFITRLLGLIYNSFTVFYIAYFEGSLMVSVYTVYNSVINLVSNFLQAVLSSPQNALGQIYVTDKRYFEKKFLEFEFIGITVTCIFFSTTAILLMPFVKLYTSGVDDISYYNLKLGNLLIITAVLQMIHIPSGKCIELTGRFRMAKNIQLIGLIVLILFSGIGAYKIGFIGLIYAKLFTNIIFVILEMGYVHSNKLLQSSNIIIIVKYIPYLLISIITTIVGRLFISSYINGIINFIIYGAIIFILTILVFLLYGLIFYKTYYVSILVRLKAFFCIKKGD